MSTYVANFSFGLVADTEPFTGGHCTAIVEAPNLADAIDKFRAYLRDMKPRHDMFTHVRKVYMDCCAEMTAAPTEPLITFCWLTEPNGGSLELHGFEEGRDVTTYGYGDEHDGEIVPFIEFE